jgi:antitoxin PrlF
MKENVIVSERGQITLPSKMRKKMGIESGGVVTVEERKGELVIRPASVIEVDIYSDEDIERWMKEDTLTVTEQKNIRKKLSRNV